MKELQTDGYLARPITIKVDGEFEVVDLILSGFPCLTYTTVPNYNFDSQELSRSFIFTPRTDNRAVFNARKSYLELKGGKTDSGERRVSLIYAREAVFRRERKLVSFDRPVNFDSLI